MRDEHIQHLDYKRHPETCIN